jgi:hypothetical protein
MGEGADSLTPEQMEEMLKGKSIAKRISLL